ncbi:hypothetical protein MNBD_ALPHA06-639 [hydrothermal vent metagenome]|uniref:Uncharacterized protein n=1 Tax=hydrothermal vent metagenome TaxID=652676 RepID=A0A3B0RG54_9ZZZZ
MGFLLKAGFWFAVVLFFLPENSENLRAQREMAQSSARNLIEAVETAARFCQDQAALCETASQTSKLASSYVTVAADEITKRKQSQTP